VTVQDTNGIPLSAINVYAFNGTTYTGYSKTTNASGQAVFTLPLGSYRFRADVRGTQYWSGTENHCTLPGCESVVVISGIPATPTPSAMLHSKVAASIKPSDSTQSGSTPVVLTVLDTSGDPVAGLNAYAFNGTTYTGISGTTDAVGQVTFTLPAGSYRFRADRNGTQFWSGSENHCTTPGCETAGITVTIPLTVTVSDTSSQPSPGLKVYAFSGSAYTGYNKTTDANGQATFTLPVGSYRFRADLNGTQFWSGETDHCTLPGCTGAAVTVTVPLTLTVANQAGTPFEGLHVYAFNGTTYTGYNKVTDANGQAVFTLPVGSYRFRADYDGVPFWSGAANHCDLPGCTSVTLTIPGGAGNLVIDYGYDPLGRLTSADYSDDTSYAYTYDAVGNRMTQDASGTTTTYGYDDANRMTSVNGFTISWDSNGNLRNNGVNTYTYNGENRLIAYSNGTDTYEYTYNGLGDRLSQIVNGVVTNYTLDLNAGLTQVLNDGTNSYLYGLSRIAENQGGAIEYSLGDALGSVRQLVNGDGEVTLSKSYDPFGNNLLSIGTSETAYGYTGESTDANGLIYLRARYYNPEQGRFITRDTWEGGVYAPNSLNRFAYANNDPVKNSDPSGYCVFAGVDTYICGIIAGGFIGAFTGAAFGGSYAAWMYHLALTGKCGCEGDLLIRKYTKTQFILSAVEQGAAFGAVFGALSAAGFGGVAFAAIAGVGFSTVGLINSVQRIQVAPNNECAWWDLGMSILGLTSSLSTLATARVFYNKAVQNPGSTKGSLIGDWIKDSPLSYENIAKKYGFKHLDLKGIYYEMFKGIFGEKLWGQLINEPYIRGIAREGKPVYLSTNPKNIRASSNVQFEYNLLIELGYGEAVPEPTTGLWIMNKP